MKLSELIRQERFSSTAQESMLNVMVTSNWIYSELAAMLAPAGITPAQYNVLRILRGSHPRKLTCSEIGERLLDRTPDVTRLLDRLEKAELVRRERASYDRRVVEVTVTERGLELLGRVQDQTYEFHRRINRHLTADEQRLLSDLLERMRTDQR